MQSKHPRLLGEEAAASIPTAATRPLPRMAELPRDILCHILRWNGVLDVCRSIQLASTRVRKCARASLRLPRREDTFANKRQLAGALRVCPRLGEYAVCDSVDEFERIATIASIRRSVKVRTRS